MSSVSRPYNLVDRSLLTVQNGVDHIERTVPLIAVEKRLDLRSAIDCRSEAPPKEFVCVVLEGCEPFKGVSNVTDWLCWARDVPVEQSERTAVLPSHVPRLRIAVTGDGRTLGRHDPLGPSWRRPRPSAIVQCTEQRAGGGHPCRCRLVWPCSFATITRNQAHVFVPLVERKRFGNGKAVSVEMA